jgi:hypothetical protein
MSIKTREVIWGGRIMGAKMRAETARHEARKAARAADRAEAESWSVRKEGYGGPARPSPTIGQCLNRLAGDRVLSMQDVASMPLDAIRRPRDTPIWKLEPSSRRYSPLQAVDSHDQVDRGEGDHRVTSGSRRTAVASRATLANRSATSARGPQ